MIRAALILLILGFVTGIVAAIGVAGAILKFVAVAFLILAALAFVGGAAAGRKSLGAGSSENPRLS